MIQLKNQAQIAIMKEAGRITGEALLLACEAVKEGVTTKHLDDIIRHHIERCGARPSFLGYGGFPASACISINDEVIHGIPSPKRFLQEGDIVKIDVGALYKGFHGDSANTVGVGHITPQAQRLIEATRESFYRGLTAIRPNARLGDIGAAIDGYVRTQGFSTVRRYVGHGIGHELHMEPDVPNYGIPGRGVRLCAGMTIAIEPMVNGGGCEVLEMPDGWTVKTAYGSLSAHYEHTVAVTAEGAVLLTKVS